MVGGRGRREGGFKFPIQERYNTVNGTWSKREWKIRNCAGEKRGWGGTGELERVM